MQAKAYTKKLTRLIQQHQLTSITVDIFDTILLHEYWPSDLEQLHVAEDWLDIFQELVSPQITIYELYDWRRFARQLLRERDEVATVENWFTLLIEQITSKYQVTLDADAYRRLSETMLHFELQNRLKRAKVNEPLILALSSIKAQYPELKLYFVSDSYFNAGQVKFLLEMKHVTIFDDGICSSDLGFTKRDGDLFELLPALWAPDFRPASNLHIGDRRLDDYLMPLAHDQQAWYYRPCRFRGMRTLVGKGWLKIVQTAARHRTLVRLDPHFNKKQPWQNLGFFSAQIDSTGRPSPLPKFFDQAAHLTGVNSRRAAQITLGREQGNTLLDTIELSPISYLQFLDRYLGRRLVRHPSRYDVIVYGSITDPETGEPVIDLSATTLQAWKKALRHPGKTLRFLRRPDIWTAGYCKYYHLGLFKLFAHQH